MVADRARPSRAFVAVLPKGGAYTPAELAFIRSHAQNKCVEWMEATPQTNASLLSQVDFYLRYPSLVAVSTVERLHSKLEVATTTMSLKRQREQYTQRGLKIEAVQQMPRKAVKSRTTALARVMDVVNAKGGGKVAWVNSEERNEAYHQLVLALVSRPGVLVAEEIVRHKRK
ncbi:hypothetical protein F443_14741, partial [Phytophthora nicotianae P1569]